MCSAALATASPSSLAPGGLVAPAARLGLRARQGAGQSRRLLSPGGLGCRSSLRRGDRRAGLFASRQTAVSRLGHLDHNAELLRVTGDSVDGLKLSDDLLERRVIALPLELCVLGSGERPNKILRGLGRLGTPTGAPPPSPPSLGSGLGLGRRRVCRGASLLPVALLGGTAAPATALTSPRPRLAHLLPPFDAR